uniref:Uncharacterized protein n=1 Tax=Octactis speculum TaxID=3111310 RepID=A0A7S2DRX6_9STRA|mmetsp:Transcript_53433/g.73004  ORF Transcript_53433/g.73004 Transcript_53433/m.73004 type:complete len:122 (+) Transcript_53433:141-506(+)
MESTDIKAGVLDRIKLFLPKIAEANENLCHADQSIQLDADLKESDQAGDIKDTLETETSEEGSTSPMIQMEVAIGVLDDTVINHLENGSEDELDETDEQNTSSKRPIEIGDIIESVKIRKR